MNSLTNKLKAGFQTIGLKVKKADTTDDEEYSAIFNRFEKCKKLTGDASKHFQQLIENFHAFTATLQFISEDFRDAAPDSSAPMHENANRLASVIESIESRGIKPFQDAMLTDCIAPLQEYSVVFKPIKDYLDRRHRAVVEYDTTRQRVKELTEKQSTDPLALPRAKEKMSKAKEDYELTNAEAKTQMADIISKHELVFDGLLEKCASHLSKYFAAVAQSSQAIDKLKATGSASRPAVTTAAATRAIPSAPASHPPPAAAPSAQNAQKEALRNELDVEWYYLGSQAKQLGPVSFADLQALFKRGEVNDTTHVFGGEMDNWKQVKDVPRLKLGLSTL